MNVEDHVLKGKLYYKLKSQIGRGVGFKPLKFKTNAHNSNCSVVLIVSGVCNGFIHNIGEFRNRIKPIPYIVYTKLIVIKLKMHCTHPNEHEKFCSENSASLSTNKSIG